MKRLIEHFKLRERLSARKSKAVLLWLILGLFMVLLFCGKPFLSMALEAAAISPDEQYIACFEPSSEYRIHCFRIDGSKMFTYNVPVNISAGGNCSLWFEEDLLFAFFYRTNKVVQITLNGSIRSVIENVEERSRPEFPNFTRRNNQYVFSGDEITVIYDEKSFWQYCFLNEERYLKIVSKNGEQKIICAWTAKEGMIEKCT